jgi:hypothetical protein
VTSRQKLLGESGTFHVIKGRWYDRITCVGVKTIIEVVCAVNPGRTARPYIEDETPPFLKLKIGKKQVGRPVSSLRMACPTFQLRLKGGFKGSVAP